MFFQGKLIYNIYKEDIQMSNEKKDIRLKEVKERLEGSGISRREALAAALGACGVMLVTLGAGAVQVASSGQRSPSRDCSDSCAQSCVSCRDGCSSGPNK
jgi:hypothetical protein